MTRAEKILFSYLREHEPNTEATPTGRGSVLTSDGRELAINLFGDILDVTGTQPDGKGRLIAESDIKADLLAVATKTPTKWERL